VKNKNKKRYIGGNKGKRHNIVVTVMAMAMAMAMVMVVVEKEEDEEAPR
jgi:hypothetical protein